MWVANWWIQWRCFCRAAVGASCLAAASATDRREMRDECITNCDRTTRPAASGQYYRSERPPGRLPLRTASEARWSVLQALLSWLRQLPPQHHSPITRPTSPKNHGRANLTSSVGSWWRRWCFLLMEAAALTTMSRRRYNVQGLITCQHAAMTDHQLLLLPPMPRPRMSARRHPSSPIPPLSDPRLRPTPRRSR